MQYLDKDGLTRYDNGIKKKFEKQRRIVEVDKVIDEYTNYSENIQAEGTAQISIEEGEVIDKIEIDIRNEIDSIYNALTLTINETEYEFSFGGESYSLFGDEYNYDKVEIKRNTEGKYDVTVTKQAKLNSSGIIIGDTPYEIYNQTIDISFLEGTNYISLEEYPDSIIKAQKTTNYLGYNIGIKYKIRE